MFTEAKIKKDLKNLKYFNNSIKVYKEASEYFKRQYNLAKNNNLLTDAEVKELESCIELIDSNTYVSQTMELKERYFREIAKLDDFTRTIIVDVFINESTYLDISKKMYCSTETVKRRVKAGIKFLIERMNGEE